MTMTRRRSTGYPEEGHGLLADSAARNDCADRLELGVLEFPGGGDVWSMKTWVTLYRNSLGVMGSRANKLRFGSEVGVWPQAIIFLRHG